MKRTLYYFILRTFAGLAASFHSRRMAAWWSFTWDKLYTLYMLHFLQEGSSERILLCRHSSFYHPEYIRIGEGTSMQRSCRVEAHDAYRGVCYRPEIIIGKHCNFGEYNHLTAIHRMVIGDGVLTGRRVTISDNNHGPFLREVLDEEPALRVLSSKGPVTIGDNVWIGENACVLSGVTVGRGSVIAANAVVTRDVPPYSLVAGVPAKVIRQFV